MRKSDGGIGGRASFTLIELLVVVAIIAILAALLFPAMSTVKQKSRAVLCQSNKRQCMLATTSYASDFNGQTPPAAADNATPRACPARLWYVNLLFNEYIPRNCVISFESSNPNYAVLRYPNVVSCPSFPLNPAWTYPQFNTCFAPRAWWVPANSNEVWNSYGGTVLWNLKADIPYLADTFCNNPSYLCASAYWYGSAYWNDTGVYLIHQRQAVAAYPDGHAASLGAALLAAAGVSAIFQP